MMTDTIVIKAPAGTKARWVRQSQSQGQKLSDWVVGKIEGNEMKVGDTVQILGRTRTLLRPMPNHVNGWEINKPVEGFKYWSAGTYWLPVSKGLLQDTSPAAAREILDTILDKTGAGLTAQGFELFPPDLVSIEGLHATYDFQAAVRLLMRLFPQDAEWIERETMVEP